MLLVLKNILVIKKIIFYLKLFKKISFKIDSFTLVNTAKFIQVLGV